MRSTLVRSGLTAIFTLATVMMFTTCASSGGNEESLAAEEEDRQETGGSCSTRDDCLNFVDFCVEGGCTTVECSTNEDCPEGAVCDTEGRLCYLRCASDDDCMEQDKDYPKCVVDTGLCEADGAAGDEAS